MYFQKGGLTGDAVITVNKRTEWACFRAPPGQATSMQGLAIDGHCLEAATPQMTPRVSI